MNNRKTSKKVVIYEEVFDGCDVSENDIEEYSKRLGIDLKANPSLATSIRDWILQPLPRYWFPCRDTQTGHWFYSNALNGQSTWHHPLEEIHRNLAKQFCFSNNIRSPERGIPEGESPEQSMETGFSSKLFGSSTPSNGGLPPARNPLPRALAPLKRVPKAEPVSLLKTSANPLPSFSSTNPSLLREENVRDVSFSTFKSTDPIPSLIPGDLLYGNRDRPVTHLSPFNYSAQSLKYDIPSISISKEEDKQTTETAVFSHTSRNINSLTSDTGKEPTTNSISNVEMETTSREPKPITRVSFTERLAAKKASRLKSNESSEACSNNNSNELDQTSAINVDKKQVHFNLEVQEVRQYTPEYSEEIKAADKSESSSSEDILDLVGDPEFLKPLSDINCSEFEEKRWEVSFTSFGLNSDNGSPTKVLTNDNDEEMVTRFNSEYCPSPLPASSCTEKSDDDHSIVCPTTTNADFNVSTNLTVPKVTLEQNVMPTNATVVPIFYEDVHIQQTDETDETARVQENSPIDSPSPSIETFTAQLKEEEPITPAVNKALVEPEILENVHVALPSRKNRPPSLARSVTRSDSLEQTIIPESTQSIKSDLPPIHSQKESINDSKFVEPSTNCNSAQELHVSTSSTSQRDILSPPSPFYQKPCLQVAIETQTEDSLQTNKASDSVRVCKEIQTTSQVLEEDWVKMKKEMESTLENEKKKLEHWFSSELAQIKKQFEAELASERQRTESLSKLVESANSEKEELAKRKITNLEESLTNLIEEKTRQIQTRLSCAAVQENNTTTTTTVMNRVVDRQDANVQTEEPVSVTNTAERRRASTAEETEISDSIRVGKESRSRSENRETLESRRDPSVKYQCDTLHKKVARVEREIQLLKQKNLSFQKNATPKKKSTPIKAQRESWWMDADDTSTTSSMSDWRYSRARSKSLTNLHLDREPLGTGNKNMTPTQRARDLLSKNQTPRRAWMEDVSSDNSSADTLTSGVSSAVSTGEWDTVLTSIQKISGDLQEVWSHLGPRPRPLSYISYQSPIWMPSTPSLIINDRVPLHWSLSGSTAERTQALKLWLQRSKTQYSKPLL